MKNSQSKKPAAAIEMHTAMIRSSESGSEMIKNYGKIEAVIEMYQDGTVDPGLALKRIIQIVKGEVSHV